MDTYFSMKSKHSFVLVWLMGFAVFCSIEAFATLGGRVFTPTAADPENISQATPGQIVQSQKLQAQKILVQGSSYSVQESTLGGVAVREYVLPNGVVFAVTWRGIKHPDLSLVLGNYHPEFEKLKAQKVKAIGRAPLHINSSKVSVKMSGHMRDVRGEAYDPVLLPTNFSLQELK